MKNKKIPKFAELTTWQEHLKLRYFQYRVLSSTYTFLPWEKAIFDICFIFSFCTCVFTLPLLPFPTFISFTNLLFLILHFFYVTCLFF